MIRPVWLVTALVFALAPRGSAQGDSVGSFRHAVVHYGKWLPVAVAVAFTAMGAHEHDNSQREFDRLLVMCRADNADCTLGSDGRYLNPAAERLYQASVTFDRRARARLLAGQASLLVAAGLFIADLRQRSRGPGNKPFAPLEVLGDVWVGGARVGLRATF